MKRCGELHLKLLNILIFTCSKIQIIWRFYLKGMNGSYIYCACLESGNVLENSSMCSSTNFRTITVHSHRTFSLYTACMGKTLTYED